MESYRTSVVGRRLGLSGRVGSKKLIDQ